MNTVEVTLRRNVLAESLDSAKMRARLVASINGYTVREERIIKDALAERGITVTTPDRGVGEFWF